MKNRKHHWLHGVAMSPTERRLGRYLRSLDGHDGEPPAASEEGDAPPADRPEWLPEKFWTPEGPSVENLAKSYVELERQRGASIDDLRSQWEAERLAVRPEAADKYELPAHDALDPEAMAASPIIGLWRELAFESGLPQDKFSETIQRYADAELARITAEREAELALLGENAKARTEAVSLWARGLFKDEKEFSAVQGIAETAAGVAALERIMNVLRDTGVDLSAFEEAGGKQQDTREEIHRLMQTREYWDPKRRDPAVVKRVEEFFANGGQ